MAQKLITSTLGYFLTKGLPRRCILGTTKRPDTARRLMSSQISASQDSPPEETHMPAIDESRLLLAQEDKNDFFGLNDLFTVEDLFNARVHFGHKEGMLNGHMRPYIFGKRLGVLIFDLEKTARMLNQALNVTAEIAYRNGIILFMYQSRQSVHLVEAAAKECGEYAYCRRWRNAVFTDSQKTFGSVTKLPDLVILFSVLERVGFIHRAAVMSAKMLIPTIGVCDTDVDPTLITYPIPGNDDTPQSIELYCNLFKTAVKRGKEKRNEILYGRGN